MRRKKRQSKHDHCFSLTHATLMKRTHRATSNAAKKKWCSNIKESCTCHLRAPTSFKCLHLHYTCQQVCICAFTLTPFICFSLKFGSYRFNYFKSIKFHLISPNWATNVFQKINGAQWLISDILSITYHYLFKKKDT
jgi:hypothetical protein